MFGNSLLRDMGFEKRKRAGISIETLQNSTMNKAKFWIMLANVSMMLS
ncbi:hypothetical protein SCAR479_08568 [Seiridium cardinale]|uniref:Uncharacterized protein n=1 Tax=Seiridium cardinale TaxID=138064 RepID=A0ABR2XLS7_9PEZI